MNCTPRSIGFVGFSLLLTLVAFAAQMVPTPTFAQSIESAQEERKALFRRLAPSVVFIKQKQVSGSGFFVSTDGLLITNGHVVGDAKSVRVVTFDGTKTTGTVVEKHKKYDLALVRVPLKDTPAMNLVDTSKLEVGDWAATIGHGHGGVWAFTVGMVSNIYPIDGIRVIQTQIPVNPGNSGGPVFDRTGRVVGIVTSKVVDADTMNFAIPADLALSALEKLRNTCDCLVIEAPNNSPIFLGSKMVGAGPELSVPMKPGTYEVSTVINGKRVKKTVKWPKVSRVVLE